MNEKEKFEGSTSSPENRPRNEMDSSPNKPSNPTNIPTPEELGEESQTSKRLVDPRDQLPPDE